MILAKQAENMDDKAIKSYLDENQHLLLCQECNGKCHAGSVYRKFSGSLSTCASALLCEKVHVPELDLPCLDINFHEKSGEMDEFFIHREECCYGAHCGLAKDDGGILREYPKCGWDAVFRDLPLHERKVLDPSNMEETIHRIHACPSEYCREGKVTWMDFVKVSMFS